MDKTKLSGFNVIIAVIQQSHRNFPHSVNSQTISPHSSKIPPGFVTSGQKEINK